MSRLEVDAAVPVVHEHRTGAAPPGRTLGGVGGGEIEERSLLFLVVIEHAPASTRVGHHMQRRHHPGLYTRGNANSSVLAISLRTIDRPSSTPMPGLASIWSACAPSATCVVTWALRSVSAQEPPTWATTPCARQSRIASTVFCRAPRSGVLIWTTSAAP